MRHHQLLDGCAGGDAEVNNMYGHAIATIALCEAFGMTNDPALRPAAQRAVTFIVNAQSKSDPSKGGGGWRRSTGHCSSHSVSSTSEGITNQRQRGQRLSLAMRRHTRPEAAREQTKIRHRRCTPGDRSSRRVGAVLPYSIPSS